MNIYKNILKNFFIISDRHYILYCLIKKGQLIKREPDKL